MENQNNSDKNPKENISILKALFSKGERDTAYRKDVKKQWDQMEAAERTQFILGSLFGLIIFFGALFLVFLLLFRLFR